MSHYPHFSFEILKTSATSQARLGTIHTPHGVIQTPSFIFCATKAAMKGVSAQQVKDCGTQIILSNTYHLMLQPGADLVEKMGGLHTFMGWQGPMLTDSGGFQIFSLGHGSVAAEIKGRRMTNRPKTMLKITENGATFKSYIDGAKHLLTPEKSIDVQRKLGADIILVLDECTPFHVDHTYTARSMAMSHRWALRSLAEFDRGNDGRQSLYGIIQGGIHSDLRQESADFVNAQPFFGHAVGGSLGANKAQMYEVVAMTMARLRPDRPVHLLGIGGIGDIFEGVKNGIDTFDCVHPTRLARHGGALVQGHSKEHINLKNAQYGDDPRPIEKGCPCHTCSTVSRAYLHHLLKAKELYALQAITIHNITFMNRLLTAIRRALAEDRLETEKKNWMPA